MGCWKKPVWNEYTREELFRIEIGAPDRAAARRVRENWDALAKPIDGMGRFERLTAKIGGMVGSARLDLGKKAVVVFCADNGIVEERVSQSGQEVTAAVARSMARGRSPVCLLAKAAGADVFPVDIGIASEKPIPGLLDRKVRRGTRNFRKEAAMEETEAIRAIAAGIGMAQSCAENGYGVLAAGELGIGNTATSSAVAAALLRCGADEVTGRGAGLSDAGLRRKRCIVDGAVEKHGLAGADALAVLASVGGLDIAGLAGLCIGGALFRVPIVLDGAISLAAALTAERMFPGVREFLLPSHKGREPAAGKILKELGMRPVLDADLALGEGTGAVMFFPLLDLALSVYRDGAAFSEIDVAPYKRRMQEG